MFHTSTTRSTLMKLVEILTHANILDVQVNFHRIYVAKMFNVTPRNSQLKYFLFSWVLCLSFFFFCLRTVTSRNILCTQG